MYAMNISKYIGLGVLVGTMFLFSHQRFIELHDIVPHGWFAFILHAILLITAGFLLLEKSWNIKKLNLKIAFFPSIYLGLLVFNIILVHVYHPSDPVLPSINQTVFPLTSLLTLILLPFGLLFAFLTQQMNDAGLSRKSILLCDFLLFGLWILLYPIFHLVAISFVSWII